MRKVRFPISEPDRPGPLALDLMARATVNQIRDDAAELSELFAELSEDQRAKLMVLLFGADG